MQALQAANLYGERVDVCTSDGEAVNGRIEALDAHGLMVVMPNNSLSQRAYIPWSTVTGVYILRGDSEDD